MNRNIEGRADFRRLKKNIVRFLRMMQVREIRDKDFRFGFCQNSPKLSDFKRFSGIRLYII